ncbi:MAG: prepilin-type N-terminal cleavage/methylation domain-containing protein [Lachnospiraceae bacterium]|nr:prepilin-type N-terminal cleavage/methylation domain-containing protein [Lachnospiraceae bacterium]
MTDKTYGKINTDNRGETLVEVMVAFTVLMIVVAMFTGATNFASATINNSIDIRRTADEEYENFRKELSKEKKTGSPSTTMRTAESPVSVTIAGTDGNHDLIAYQYKSGDSIYWVFR